MSLLAGAVGASVVGGLVGSYLNYKSQKENLSYQKGIQQQIFGREDNAQQRAVADLRAAGLSPTLAAGAGAQAGPVVKTDAPQIDTASPGNNALNVMSMLKMKEDITKTKAETEYIKQQAVKTGVERDIQMKMLQPNINQVQTGISLHGSQAAVNWRDYNISRDDNMTSNPSGPGRIFRDANRTISNIVDAAARRMGLQHRDGIGPEGRNPALWNYNPRTGYTPK